MLEVAAIHAAHGRDLHIRLSEKGRQIEAFHAAETPSWSGKESTIVKKALLIPSPTVIIPTSAWRAGTPGILRTRRANTENSAAIWKTTFGFAKLKEFRLLIG